MNCYSDIIIHRPLSSSTQEQKYLLSYNGKYYEASIAVVELLKELQQSSTEEEAIESYVRKNEKYTLEQIRQVVDKFIIPMFRPTAEKQTFLYEKELFSAKSIDKFSNKFQILFNKKYMGMILVVTLFLDAYFFSTTHDLLLFNNKVNIYMVAGLLVFILLSSFFHELGHASSCKHFKTSHGGIGFGLYLNFPVLYTDVTEVWKLSRKQRCIVNLAGVYFQSYLLIMLLIVFLLTSYDILRYLILIMNLGFLMTLNPFFKFDGYWLASDLLGVPNLRKRSLELLGYLYKSIGRKSVPRKPYLLQIRPLEKYGLLIYSLVVNIFMGFYFFYIIPVFLYHFFQKFPDAVNELILYLSNRIIPPFALLRNISTQLLFLGLIGYLLYKMINPLIKRLCKKITFFHPI